MTLTVGMAKWMDPKYHWRGIQNGNHRQLHLPARDVRGLLRSYGITIRKTAEVIGLPMVRIRQACNKGLTCGEQVRCSYAGRSFYVTCCVAEWSEALQRWAGTQVAPLRLTSETKRGNMVT